MSPLSSSVPDEATIARRIVRDIPEVPSSFSLDLPFDDAEIDSLVLAEAAAVATLVYHVPVHDWELREAGTMREAGVLIRERIASTLATT